MKYSAHELLLWSSNCNCSEITCLDLYGLTFDASWDNSIMQCLLLTDLSFITCDNWIIKLISGVQWGRGEEAVEAEVRWGEGQGEPDSRHVCNILEGSRSSRPVSASFIMRSKSPLTYQVIGSVPPHCSTLNFHFIDSIHSPKVRKYMVIPSLHWLTQLGLLQIRISTRKKKPGKDFEDCIRGEHFSFNGTGCTS
jgi:hypothetical protein